MSAETAVGPADVAFIALADHSTGCPACRPDPNQPDHQPPDCPAAWELYRIWRQACRAERSAPL